MCLNIQHIPWNWLFQLQEQKSEFQATGVSSYFMHQMLHNNTREGGNQAGATGNVRTT